MAHRCFDGTYYLGWIDEKGNLTWVDTTVVITKVGRYFDFTCLANAHGDLFHRRAYNTTALNKLIMSIIFDTDFRNYMDWVLLKKHVYDEYGPNFFKNNFSLNHIQNGMDAPSNDFYYLYNLSFIRKTNPNKVKITRPDIDPYGEEDWD